VGVKYKHKTSGAHWAYNKEKRKGHDRNINNCQGFPLYRINQAKTPLLMPKNTPPAVKFVNFAKGIASMAVGRG
jgi:hypothetical protein